MAEAAGRGLKTPPRVGFYVFLLIPASRTTTLEAGIGENVQNPTQSGVLQPAPSDTDHGTVPAPRAATSPPSEPVRVATAGEVRRGTAHFRA